MYPIKSSPATLPKYLRWTIAALLAALLVSAMGDAFGPVLTIIALGALVVGIIAMVRGRLAAFNIPSRRVAGGVLIAGFYLLLLGVFVGMQTDGPIAPAVAAGDKCEMVGTVHEQDDATFYCIPEEEDAAWATAQEFEAYQDEEAQKLATETEAHIKAASEEYEEQLAAAEERADTAETELKDYKKEVVAAAEAREEEELAAAEAEEQRQQERQQREATQPAPAPAPTQAPAAEPEPNTPNRAFKNCTEARNAGAAPILRGEPGYGSHLDRDGDGVGCE